MPVCSAGRDFLEKCLGQEHIITVVCENYLQAMTMNLFVLSPRLATTEGSLLTVNPPPPGHGFKPRYLVVMLTTCWLWGLGQLPPLPLSGPQLSHLCNTSSKIPPNSDILGLHDYVAQGVVKWSGGERALSKESGVLVPSCVTISCDTLGQTLDPSEPHL